MTKTNIFCQPFSEEADTAQELVLFWLENKHLKFHLMVNWRWQHWTFFGEQDQDEEVENKIKVKTSTESWSVRGMIWTVYKHWSAPSFEKMFLTVIDSEKSRTMSPSPGDIWAHFWSEMCRNWCIWQFPLLRTVDIIKLVAGDQLCKKMSEMRRKQRWCTMLGGLMCTNDVVH